ncbi:MAG TPA: hypothetical protein VNE62_06580 [Actinomycetota bacterium]|nr:hypothetical protein [Actinomycetota bacterium]
MSIRRSLGCLAVAAGILVGLLPVVGGTAQAGQCDPEVYVFSQTGVFLPQPIDDPRGGQITSLGNPSITSNFFGCAASPDFEANTNLVYPGATLISSRFLTGAASTWCFSGLLNECGPASVQEGGVPGTFYTESGRKALDPTRVGCVTASFDNRGHVDYCTLESLRP